MSEVLLGGAGVGARGGVCVCVCAGGRRRRFFRFFFFGLTGASAGRTVEGEIPPVGPLVAVVPGVVPPLVPPAEGTTPPVAADALVDPQTNATRSTKIANAERNRFAPCMGVGIGPARTAV
jgi:hypothetical protein